MSTFRTPSADRWEALWALAAGRFALGSHSLHGPDHWQRVERNGLRLAADTRADVATVRLFAVLHDARRENESHDPDHGQRADDWAATLRGDWFELPDADFDRLCHALIWHDKGRTSDDATVGTCWDADRLDLPRVGIRPAPGYMSTSPGRKLAGGR